MPPHILPPDPSAYVNCEPGKAAPPPCKPDQWRVIVEMSAPLPVNNREIEIIENCFAEFIDDLLSAKTRK